MTENKILVIVSRAEKLRECGLGDFPQSLADDISYNNYVCFEDVDVQYLSDLEYDTSDKVNSFLKKEEIYPSFILLHLSTFKDDDCKSLAERPNCSVRSLSHDANGVFHRIYEKIVNGDLSLKDVEKEFPSNDTLFLSRILDGSDLSTIDVPKDYRKDYEEFRKTVTESFNRNSPEHIEAFRKLRDEIKK